MQYYSRNRSYPTTEVPEEIKQGTWDDNDNFVEAENAQTFITSEATDEQLASCGYVKTDPPPPVHPTHETHWNGFAWTYK